MEDIKGKLCNLCFHIIQDENFKLIKEIVQESSDMLLLIADLESEDHMVCSTCCTKLTEALNFKSLCLDTENTIYPYIRLENDYSTELKDIYLKVHGEEHLTDEVDQKICRLCMQLGDDGFMPLDQVDVTIIHKYIPEINLTAIKDPVICESCCHSLYVNGNFLNSFLNVKEDLKYDCNNDTMDDDCKETKFEFVHIKSEQTETRSEENEAESDVTHNSWTGIEPLQLGNTFKVKEEVPSHSKTSETNESETPLYKCTKCNYRTPGQINLKRHQIAHRDASELKTNKVDPKAELKDRDPREIPLLKCDICDYTTYYTTHLKAHDSAHRDLSGNIYKCDECKFTTKRKYNLKCHMMRHRETSEYFNARHKINTEQPKDRVKLKCTKCNFSTYHKAAFSSHHRKHGDPCPAPVFKCDKCDFSTKYKGNLRCHQLVHSDPLKSLPYKCAQCDYATDRLISLSRHRLIHRDPSQLPSYKCDKCDFSARRWGTLQCHQLVHVDPSKIQTYKGDTAAILNTGIDLDQSENLPQFHMYKCAKCSYCTESQESIRKHVLTKHEPLKGRARGKSAGTV